MQRRTILVCLAAAAAAAGCSSTSTTPSPTSSGAQSAAGSVSVSASVAPTASAAGPVADSVLLDALASVAKSARSASLIGFSQPAAALEANGGSRTAQDYKNAIDVGDDLGAHTADLQQRLGITVSQATSAIQVYASPKATAVRLVGVDTDSLAVAAERYGAKVTTSARGTTYDFGKDGPYTYYLDRYLTVDGGVLRAGTTPTSSDIFDTAGATLHDDPQYAALADCEGDALAASFRPSLPYAPLPDTVARIVVATAGAAGEDPVDTLCVAATSDAAARSLAATMTNALAHGATARNSKKWTDLLQNTNVEVVGGSQHLVRLTGTPLFTGAGAMLTFQFDLASLLGS